MLCNNNKKVDIKTSSIYYLQNKLYNTSYTSDTKAFRLPSHLSNAITDTGASGNYAPESALPYMVNKRAHTDDPSAKPIEVELPNGQIIRSTHTAELNLPTIPEAARKVHIFRDLQCDTLLSVGVLCDAGLIATLTAEDVKFYYGPHLVLQGKRNKFTKLWDLNISADSQPNVPPGLGVAAATIQFQTQRQAITWYHACFGYPVMSTFHNATRANWIPVPGLTAKAIRNHCPRPIATSKGHLNQQRPYIKPDQRTKLALDTKARIITTMWECTRRIHTDGTGRFPIKSLSGNQYMMVFFEEDGNYIHIEVTTDRTASSAIQAYSNALSLFNKRHGKRKIARLDNETSGKLETYLSKEHGLELEFVPPGTHRALKAERAIETWKEHFISILAGTDPEFPMHLWDELVAQGECTLNMMRPSNVDPSISAWEHMHGAYNFAKHPLAPAGIKVAVHEKPSERGTWAVHAAVGFYLGPATQHQRCYRVWIPALNSKRITDTVDWHPTANMLPPRPDISLDSNLEPSDGNLPTSVPPTKIQIVNTRECSTQTEEYTTPEVKRVPKAPEITAHQNPKTVLETSTQTLGAHTNVSPKHRINSRKSLHKQTMKPLTIPDKSTESFIVNSNAEIPRARPRRNRAIPQRFQALTVKHIDKKHPKPVALTAVDLDLSGNPLKYSAAIRGPEAAKWLQAAHEEFDRLIESKTIEFISHKNLPRGRTAAYYNPQVRTKEKEGVIERRVRGTIGGDKVDYDGETKALTATMEEVKILLNSTVSTLGAEFIALDIRNFYLGTPLLRKEYMRISRKHLPKQTIDKYNLEKLIHNESVLVEISKGIYGLPQAGKLAQDQLVAHLKIHGYNQAPNSPCVFTHNTRPIAFTLVVDDFGVKVVGEENKIHLINCLKEKYDITINEKGDKYLGINLKWYTDIDGTRCVELSMPNYIKNAIERFQIPVDKRTESAMIYLPPRYGVKGPQMAPVELPAISSERRKRIQEICGVILYYARAVDPMQLTAVSKIGSQQATATDATETAANHLLAYAATWPNATIVYKASKMQLITSSDASYLTETKGRSRGGYHKYLGDIDYPHVINGPIECNSMIIPTVCSAASDAEYCTIYLTAVSSLSTRNTLENLGHPQPPTPIYCDNTTAVGIANDLLKQRRSKSIDMRYHWIRDRVRLGQFKVYWRKGTYNLADYFTKPFSAKQTKAIRPYFVKDPPASEIPLIIASVSCKRTKNREKAKQIQEKTLMKNKR